MTDDRELERLNEEALRSIPVEPIPFDDGLDVVRMLEAIAAGLDKTGDKPVEKDE